MTYDFTDIPMTPFLDAGWRYDRTVNREGTRSVALRWTDPSTPGSGAMSMAWHGHCSKHAAHPVQRSRSTR
jgi:hypothetical protein